MTSRKHDIFEDSTDQARRAIHDASAAIISVRALAEILAEHLPVLVAISRSRLSPKAAIIQPETLDSLPSIPEKIIDLCVAASESLKALGKGSNTIENAQSSATLSGSPTEKNTADIDAGPFDCKGLRVLLVEDEETFRFALSQRLKAQGCEVTNVSNGEEALGLLDKMSFDLVLMDLRLSGMSGYETTRRLREKESGRRRHTRIIGLTASPLRDDQLLAKAAGMDDVWVKPIDEVALRSAFN